MTTATARANAARKAAEKARLEKLLLEWFALFQANPEAVASDYLAIGGTEQELHAFVVMLKQRGLLK